MTMWHHKIRWSAAISMGITGAAWGQCDPIETQKLVAPDGAPSDRFGVAVSLSGDTALVGADLDDDRGADSGSAYIFERLGGVWTQTAKLTAADGAATDWFGSAVSVSGDLALVGSPNDDDDGAVSGSVYVFEKADGGWMQTAKLTASDGAPDVTFGRSVSVSGDTAVVGASLDDANGADSGSAYIFERLGGVWTQVAKLTASDGSRGDQFGYSVSISGGTALVGARADDAGSAYVFERVGGVWTEVAKLTAPDGQVGDQLGFFCSVNSDTAIAGVFSDDDRRQDLAYVFERIDGVWTHAGRLTASDVSEFSHFGRSVALSGDLALVGAELVGDGRGSAYLFERVDGVWAEVAKLTASDGSVSDQFGISVSLSGDTGLVGAWRDDSLTGSAYTFDLRCACPADFNGDGVANTLDVLAFLNAWTTQDPRADFNDDGTIDTRDVLAFLNAWTAGCERE